MKILRSAVGSLVSLGLIKELQKYGIEVIGMDSDPCNFGRFYLDNFYKVPRSDCDNFISDILKILLLEKPNAILPGPDAEIYELSLYKEEIEEFGTVLLCPDFYYVDICVDKLKTHGYFNSAEIPQPKLYMNGTIDFPLFIKPRFGSGSHGAYKVNNKEELKHKCGIGTNLPYAKNVNNFNMYNGIIQEYVEGIEYSIDTLGNKDGNMICCVPRIRCKTSNGLSIIGKTVKHIGLINYCRDIVKDLKLFGPSCIQCIEMLDGELKFLEINNRFGGGAILSIKACPEFIPSLIRLINGEKVERIVPFEFKENLIMVRNFTEIFTE